MSHSCREESTQQGTKLVPAALQLTGALETPPFSVQTSDLQLAPPAERVPLGSVQPRRAQYDSPRRTSNSGSDSAGPVPDSLRRRVCASEGSHRCDGVAVCQSLPEARSLLFNLNGPYRLHEHATEHATAPCSMRLVYPSGTCQVFFKFASQCMDSETSTCGYQSIL